MDSMTKDNQLVAVVNGKPVPIEDYYRDKIVTDGEEVIRQMFAKYSQSSRQPEVVAQYLASEEFQQADARMRAAKWQQIQSGYDYPPEAGNQDGLAVWWIVGFVIVVSLVLWMLGV